MHRSLAIFVMSMYLIGAACSTRVVYDTHSSEQSVSAVNINTASVDELERLPHIGRKTAQSIVAFREQNGPFRRVEHLLLIRGVSESRFAELRPMVSVE